MKLFNSLDEEQSKILLQNLMTDIIIIERFYEILDVITQKLPENDPYIFSHYSGIYNLFSLLGYPFPETLEEEDRIFPITEKLYNLYQGVIESKSPNGTDKKVSELSLEVIEKWNNFLYQINNS